MPQAHDDNGSLNAPSQRDAAKLRALGPTVREASERLEQRQDIVRVLEAAAIPPPTAPSPGQPAPPPEPLDPATTKPLRAGEIQQVLGSMLTDDARGGGVDYRARARSLFGAGRDAPTPSPSPAPAARPAVAVSRPPPGMAGGSADVARVIAQAFAPRGTQRATDSAPSAMGSHSMNSHWRGRSL